MKVKLAAQVLSHSVHAALLTLVCSKDLLLKLLNADTSEFVRKVDNLFNYFNSESME